MTAIIFGLMFFAIACILNTLIYQFVYAFPKEVNYLKLNKICSPKKFNFPRKQFFVILTFSTILPVAYLRFENLNLSVWNFLIFLLLYVAMNFFSFFDVRHMEVPEIVTVALPVLVFGINLILLILKNFGSLESNPELFGSTYIPEFNIAAMAVIILFFLMLIVMTHGNGMGGGDIRIVALIGLILGVNTIMGIYISIIVSLVFSVPYILLVSKKIKGVQLPFVPFLTLGLYLAIITGVTFTDLFLL